MTNHLFDVFNKILFIPGKRKRETVRHIRTYFLQYTRATSKIQYTYDILQKQNMNLNVHVIEL